MTERPPPQEPANPNTREVEASRVQEEGPTLADLTRPEEDPAALVQEDEALWDDDDLPSWA